MPVATPAIKSEDATTSNSAQIASRPIDDDGETGRVERTFITFSDEAAYKNCCPFQFMPEPTARPISVSALYCVVTGLPAKYRDPLTKLPYATAEAYNTIRRAYYMHVKEHGNRSEISIARWLNHWKHTYENF